MLKSFSKIKETRIFVVSIPTQDRYKTSKQAKRKPHEKHVPFVFIAYILFIFMVENLYQYSVS